MIFKKQKKTMNPKLNFSHYLLYDNTQPVHFNKLKFFGNKKITLISYANSGGGN